MRRVIPLRHSRKGTSTLEFALMLPLVMLFFIGIIQYSFFFFMDQSLQTFVTYAARSAVIEAQAAAQTGASAPFSSSPSQVTNLGTLLQVTPALDPNQLTLNISEQADYPGKGITTITVTGTYPWKLPLPPSGGTLSQTTTMSFAS